MSVWTIGWLAWLAFFVVEETLALRNRTKGDTLSEHVWRWFAITGSKAPRPWVRLRRFVLLALLAWLCLHFLTGGVF